MSGVDVKLLAQGGELYSFLRTRRRVKPKAAALYVGELVLALEHLHTHAVCYRDLKVIPTPSRVLGRISPISPPFFLVFCAFSPSRRGGSNEPHQPAERLGSGGYARISRSGC